MTTAASAAPTTRRSTDARAAARRLLAVPILVALATTALAPALTNAGGPATERPTDRRVRLMPTADQPGVIDQGRAGPRPAPIEPPQGVASTWTWIDGGWGWPSSLTASPAASPSTTPMPATTAPRRHRATNQHVYYMHIGFCVGGGCAGGWPPPCGVAAPPARPSSPAPSTPSAALGQPRRPGLEGHRRLGLQRLQGQPAGRPRPASTTSARRPSRTSRSSRSGSRSGRPRSSSAPPGPTAATRFQADVIDRHLQPHEHLPQGWSGLPTAPQSAPVWSATRTRRSPTSSCTGARTTGHVYNQFTAGSAYIDIGRDGHRRRGHRRAHRPPQHRIRLRRVHHLEPRLGAEVPLEGPVHHRTATTFAGAEKTFTTTTASRRPDPRRSTAAPPSTTSTNVTLLLRARTTRPASPRCGSATTTPRDLLWDGLRDSKPWTLPAGAGTRTVSAQFRDAAPRLADRVGRHHLRPPASNTTPPVGGPPSRHGRPAPSVLRHVHVPGSRSPGPRRPDASGISKYDSSRASTAAPSARSRWPRRHRAPVSSAFTGCAPRIGSRSGLRTPPTTSQGSARARRSSSARSEENGAKVELHGDTWTRAGRLGRVTRPAAIPQRTAATPADLHRRRRRVGLAVTMGTDRGKAASTSTASRSPRSTSTTPDQAAPDRVREHLRPPARTPSSFACSARSTPLRPASGSTSMR